MQKITYASLSSLGDDFHQNFDEALKTIRARSGRTYPILINGAEIARSETFTKTSPVDTRIELGRFVSGRPGDVESAVNAAKNAFAQWRRDPWQTRVALLRKAADVMTQRQFELAAILTIEVGKNRFEAIAEVSEAIDLILYYAEQFEANSGYEIPLVTKGTEITKSVLKPFGAWAVVSPFNFPLALATGMAAGALLAGNTVVFKPASDTPWSGFALAEIFHSVGLPKGAFNFITGNGREVGEALIQNEKVDGFIFTGSRDVGTRILTEFRKPRGRPVIAEMGGKNAAIVMPSADLEDATEGIVRSAFGMGGQKCSACSRLYLHEKIYQPLLERLVEKTRDLKVGDPALRNTFLGPLINDTAINKYLRACETGKKEGRIVYGGSRIRGDLSNGFYVEPTIIDRLPATSTMFQEEFFAPILSVAKVSSLDEAINHANSTPYGLTAGIFSNEEQEQEQFFDQIEAGVTYCNRRGGATTGAWPGVQSFGGWKDSGSSGKNALGPYYVSQFMREQSQTIVKKT